MSSKYGLTSQQVLEANAAALQAYNLVEKDKRRLSKRNRILHVIRRIVGRTLFTAAWTILRHKSLRQIYGMENKEKLLLYYIHRKKRKGKIGRLIGGLRILVLLPNVYHCTCKIFRHYFKKRRHVTICSHLLAVMLAKAFNWFPEKPKLIGKFALKLLLQARMKNYDFNYFNFHKLLTCQSAPFRRKKPKPKKKKNKKTKEKKFKKSRLQKRSSKR